MDVKVEIKEEPVCLQEAGNTSLDNYEIGSEMTHFKEEINSELAEPGRTQPLADVKDEILVEEHAVLQLVPYFKEEDKVQSHLVSKKHVTLKSLKKSQPRNKPSLLNSSRVRAYCCIDCNKTYLQASHLKAHRLSHTGERPHTCIECGSTFPRKETLKTHMLIHTVQRSHICVECGHTFVRKSSLKLHMLTHSKERHYSCNECGKAFSRKCYLTSHFFTHTGARPHDCTECGKTFSHKHSLQRHLLIHSK